MAKHRPHGRPHGEPDDEPVDELSAFDAAIPAPEDAVPELDPPPANPFAPHGAAPNPAHGALPPKPLKAVAMKKAIVTMPGCPPVEVEYPADTPEPARHAAVKGAYMTAVGQWALPAEPHIDLHD